MSETNSQMPHGGEQEVDPVESVTRYIPFMVPLAGVITIFLLALIAVTVG